MVGFVVLTSGGGSFLGGSSVCDVHRLISTEGEGMKSIKAPS